jgi:hypothetical protein
VDLILEHSDRHETVPSWIFFGAEKETCVHVNKSFEPQGQTRLVLNQFSEQSKGHEGATSSFFLQEGQIWIVAIKVLKKQPSIFF